MLTSAALTAAKNRLSITVSTFDTQLTDFFDTAVDRLNPEVLKEIAVQTVAATVDDYGEATVDLSALATPLDDVRLVEATEGNQYYPADKIFRHGVVLRVRDLPTTVTYLRLYGLKAYAVSATGGDGGAAGTDIPERYELPVLWYMLSEFFDMLAGNKAKYNAYQLSAGGNAVDDMRAEAEYYENKANIYIEEKANLYGSQ